MQGINLDKIYIRTPGKCTAKSKFSPTPTGERHDRSTLEAQGRSEAARPRWRPSPECWLAVSCENLAVCPCLQVRRGHHQTCAIEMPRDKRLPCQKEACAIQKCLQEHNYQEDRCQQVIEAMKKCCKRESAINTELCLGFK